ncbi:hypothetical protein CPX_001783 [Candidatus Phytoplasma pruni]|uniref:Uncharacterized protein n=1 Tax=Candidatus Phytoplasma pruni TaxID=479893 RepID=A0A0M1MZM1_9MOLU|nr:hypothetical protein CPX_001783 [Candidatus Phytoplasma pruni]
MLFKKKYASCFQQKLVKMVIFKLFLIKLAQKALLKDLFYQSHPPFLLIFIFLKALIAKTYFKRIC